MNTWQNIYFKFKIVTHISFALGEETTGGNMSAWKNAGNMSGWEFVCIPNITIDKIVQLVV